MAISTVRGLALARPNMKITPGKALRILRELQELFQKELADLAGMKQSNISALERGVVQIGREGTCFIQGPQGSSLRRLLIAIVKWEHIRHILNHHKVD